jgi:hypothetical protein
MREQKFIKCESWFKLHQFTVLLVSTVGCRWMCSCVHSTMMYATEWAHQRKQEQLTCVDAGVPVVDSPNRTITLLFLSLMLKENVCCHQEQTCLVPESCVMLQHIACPSVACIIQDTQYFVHWKVLLSPFHSRLVNVGLPSLLKEVLNGCKFGPDKDV